MGNGYRIVTDGSQAGNRRQRTTDVELQEGPPPSKIIRQLRSNHMGMMTDDQNTFPTDMGWMAFPHRATVNPRPDRGRVMTNPSPVGSADTLLMHTPSVGDPQR